MAKKSVTIFLLVFASATFLSSSAVYAKEKFVKYSEAVKAMKTPNGDSILFEDVYKLVQNKEKILIFDARPKAEYLKQHIAGAKLPHSEAYYQADKLFRENITRTRPDFAVYLKQSVQSIPKDSQIITYCSRNCGLSKILMKELKELGFTHVRWMDGGIDSWREKGYPLES